MGNNKQWKNNGEEDKFVKKLILKGKVNRFTKADYLPKAFPAVFGSFTPGVIRNHLNSLKRNAGLYLDGDETGNEDEDFPTLEEEEEMNNQGLPPSPSTSGSEVKLPTGLEKIAHQNYPNICNTYIDPDNENKKVLLVVSLPGGSQNVKLDLATDGMSATIKYSWAKPMYNVEDLFKTQLDAKEFSAYHPMLICMRQGLEATRKKMDMAPGAAMNVQLPIKCQTSTDSWKKWGVQRDDGSQVLIAVFTGLVNEYVVKAANEDVVFQK